MSKEQMTIPKTIRVGYKERADTYTGKLAYVIYIDEKNIVRKERSWESWRSKDIPANDFPNEPTSGFVLNKKVGDYRGSWDGRKAWIRIYDPRGFEFEITVENLLYILEECSAIKGKGLEGEFVYAWDKSDLVLLPVTAQEYNNSLDFTSLKTLKVERKSMKAGNTYLDKRQRKLIYIGREVTYSDYTAVSWNVNRNNLTECSEQRQDVFYWEIDGQENGEFVFLNGINSLAKELSKDCVPNYAELYEKFKKSICGTKATDVRCVKREGSSEKFKKELIERPYWYDRSSFVGTYKGTPAIFSVQPRHSYSERHGKCHIHAFKIVALEDRAFVEYGALLDNIDLTSEVMESCEVYEIRVYNTHGESFHVHKV